MTEHVFTQDREKNKKLDKISILLQIERLSFKKFKFVRVYHKMGDFVKEMQDRSFSSRDFNQSYLEWNS